MAKTEPQLPRAKVATKVELLVVEKGSVFVAIRDSFWRLLN